MKALDSSHATNSLLNVAQIISTIKPTKGTQLWFIRLMKTVSFLFLIIPTSQLIYHSIPPVTGNTPVYSFCSLRMAPKTDTVKPPSPLFLL
jgi:hypothetical protein